MRAPLRTILLAATLLASLAPAASACPGCSAQRPRDPRGAAALAALLALPYAVAATGIALVLRSPRRAARG